MRLNPLPISAYSSVCPAASTVWLRLSDLSWTESGEEAVRKYKKGEEVEAVVLAIDVEKERISLGIKQLEGDPFGNFISVNDKGSLVKWLREIC